MDGISPGEVETRTAGRRTGSRIDPLGILRKVEVYKGPNGWALTVVEAGKNAKKVRPSEINHGNIAPSVESLGVTCDHLEHTFVLSFAALRRLHFGSPERDNTGRRLVAALGLLALAEQDARGYALRSRCDLVCDSAAKPEIVRADGATTPLSTDRGASRVVQAEPHLVRPSHVLAQEQEQELLFPAQRWQVAWQGASRDHFAGRLDTGARCRSCICCLSVAWRRLVQRRSGPCKEPRPDSRAQHTGWPHFHPSRVLS